MSCRWHMRHWFAYRGHVGSSSPTCVRCSEPNPNYDPDRDPFRSAGEQVVDVGVGELTE